MGSMPLRFPNMGLMFGKEESEADIDRLVVLVLLRCSR